MLNILLIALGGAAGALLRYWMSSGVYLMMGREFPYGTLAVNVIGSVLMGYGYILLFERLELGPEWRAGLLIGLLGAFTTFSTFSIETMELLETGHQLRAAMNVVLSVTLCILGCWLGMIVAREL